MGFVVFVVLWFGWVWRQPLQSLTMRPCHACTHQQHSPLSVCQRMKGGDDKGREQENSVWLGWRVSVLCPFCAALCHGETPLFACQPSAIISPHRGAQNWRWVCRCRTMDDDAVPLGTWTPVPSPHLAHTTLSISGYWSDCCWPAPPTTRAGHGRVFPAGQQSAEGSKGGKQRRRTNGCGLTSTTSPYRDAGRGRGSGWARRAEIGR